MAVDGKEDLRIQRTKEAIRTTFEDMICEMDYEQISKLATTTSSGGLLLALIRAVCVRA